MSKTKHQPDRKVRAAAAETGAEERQGWRRRDYTLADCMKLGLIANILFVVFIVICLIYYYTLARRDKYVIPFEFVAYTTEMMGFALFILSVVWTDRLIRARSLMKVLMPVYISIEVLLMLMEFELFPNIYPFYLYNGLSLGLIIAHVLFSAGVSLSLLQLEPENKRVQAVVCITCGIILAGMLTAAAHYRVYASILVNAFAYIFFYAAMRLLLQREEVRVDCHGDRAEETSFTSTMFAESPLLQERPEKRRRTFGQIAKDAARQLSAEEHEVLTDEDEQFEYEFNVQDDAPDDDYDDFDDPDDFDDFDGDGDAE
ncbi:MAG: hypothetical protein II723_06100 [Oscillospiraceae bacterium]|nr:hypothetical protein [Oscillospiraceae bacterium]